MKLINHIQKVYLLSIETENNAFFTLKKSYFIIILMLFQRLAFLLQQQSTIISDFKINYIYNLISWSLITPILYPTIASIIVYVIMFIHLFIFLLYKTLLIYLYFTTSHHILQLNILKRIFFYYYTLLNTILLYPSLSLLTANINSTTTFLILKYITITIILFNSIKTSIWFIVNEFPPRNYLKKRLNILEIISQFIEYSIFIPLIIGDFQQQKQIIYAINIFYYIIKIIQTLFYKTYYIQLESLHLLSYTILFNTACIEEIQLIFNLDKNSLFYLLTFPTILLFKILQYIQIIINNYLIYKPYSLAGAICLIETLHHIYQNRQIQYYILQYKILNIVHDSYCNGISSYVLETDDYEEKNGLLITELAIKKLMCCYFSKYFMKLKVEQFQSEILYLQFLDFLVTQFKNALFPYIQLKQYMLQYRKTSYYFKIISEQRIKVIQKLYETNLKLIHKNNIINENDRELYSITQLKNTDLFLDEVIPYILQVYDNKILFYNKIIKGFIKIELLYDLIQSNALAIIHIESIIKSYMNIDIFKSKFTNLNGMQINIIKQIMSTVFNDQLQAKLLENKLNEIITSQKLLNRNIVLDINLVHHQVKILNVSMIESKGRILNKNKLNIGHFFGHENVEIDHIHQIMPKFIVKQHNHFLKQYIDKGFSRFFISSQSIFVEDCEQLITPCQMKLENVFTIENDYVVNACLLKKHNIDNFILINQKGRIKGISPGIYELFRKSNVSPQEIYKNGFIQVFLWNIGQCIKSQENQIINYEGVIQQINFKLVLFVPSSLRQYMNGYRTLHKQFKNNKEELINGINVQFCTNQEIQFNRDFLTKQLDSKHQQFNFYEVKGTIYLKQIQIKGDDYLVYFIIAINDLKEKNMKQEQQTQSNFTQTLSIHNNLNSSVQSSISVKQTNKTQQETINHQFIQYQYKEDKQLMQQNEKDDSPQNLDMEMSKDKSKRFFIQKPTFKPISRIIERDDFFPKIDEDLDFKMEIIEQKMEVIEQKFEEQEEVSNQQVDMSSSVKKKHQNVISLDKIGRLRNIKEDDLDQKQASSVHTDTNKQIGQVFQHIRALQGDKKLSFNLKMILILHIMINLFIVGVCVFEVVFIENHLQEVQQIIRESKVANDLNQFFCTYSMFGQMKTLQNLQEDDYSAYVIQKLKDDSQNYADKLPRTIFDLTNRFAQFEQKGYLKPKQFYIININEIQTVNINLARFLLNFNINAFQLNQYIQSNNSLIQQRDVLSIYFFKSNLIQTIQLCDDLLNTQIEILFDTIQTHQQLQEILLIFYIFLIAFLYTTHTLYWKKHLLYEQKILMLVSKIYQSDAEIMIKQYSFIRSILSNDSRAYLESNYLNLLTNCKLMINQYKLEFKKKEDQKKNKIAKYSVLNSRIQEINFSFLPTIFRLFILWLLVSFYFLGGYLIMNQYTANTLPQIELGVDYLQLQMHYEGLTLLSELVKTDKVVNQDIFNYKYLSSNKEFELNSTFHKEYRNRTLQTFIELYKDLPTLMEDLLENIQKSTKMEENHKDQLIQVYNGNLCKQMMDLNFCNIENNEYLKKNQPNMEMDNYKDIIQYGIYEISSRLIKFINSEYDYELEMINSNFDKIKVFMKKKERRQLIIQYFLELYEPFHVFEDIIINAINSMVQQDGYQYYIYYIITGFLVLLIISLEYVWMINRKQKELRNLTFSLSNIPYEIVIDQQSIYQIKGLVNEQLLQHNK